MVRWGEVSVSVTRLERQTVSICERVSEGVCICDGKECGKREGRKGTAWQNKEIWGQWKTVEVLKWRKW